MKTLTRLADAAAVAFALTGAFVLLFGPFSISFGPFPLRLTGPDRLLFVAAALVAIRHAAHPTDPLHARLARLLRSSPDSAWAIARSAVASRLAVLLVGYLGVVTIGLSADTTGFIVSADPVLNLPARFDAGWYATIALEGYSFQGRFDRQQNVAFFPAFPLIARVAGYPLGAFAENIPKDRRLARLLWAGVFISISAFAWGCVYLWRLARDMIGDERARDAVALLAAYPFAVYFSAPYSESLFLLGIVAAFYHFRRAELARAAAWGLLVGLTRPNGCFLSIVLGVLAIQQVSQSPNRQIIRSLLSPLLAASAPGIGMLVYSAYVKHLTGQWFGWARLHETWGRTFSGLAPVAEGYGHISRQGLLQALQAAPYDAMNAFALIFALALLWPVVRRTGWACGALVVVNVLPPLVAGGVLSMGRITATVFPLFLTLAAMLPQRAITSFVTAFALGQGLAAILFFTWRPLF